MSKFGNLIAGNVPAPEEPTPAPAPTVEIVEVPESAELNVEVPETVVVEQSAPRKTRKRNKK